MNKDDIVFIKEYLDRQKIKVVEEYNFDNKKVKYSENISGWKIDKFRGDEEIVRAYILSKLVNELGYKLDNIEIEKQYDIGRPKVNKPRIDIIVRDDEKNAFLYIELKSPEEYEKDKDEIIEKQLFNLASQEKGQGHKVKYLVLYTFEITNNIIKDKCILIDYEKYSNFNDWKEVRNFSDELPKRYGKAQKEPYIKNGKKDLDTNFTHEQLDSLRKNLHNVLWGGGSTDDNDVFSSLVNIILSKIQDESEKKKGEKYDFQIFSREKYIAVCSPDYTFRDTPDCIEKLFQERLLLREEGSGTREVLERCLEAHNLSIQDFAKRMEVGSMQTIKELTKAGCGITFLYEAAVRRELEDGSLRQIPLRDFPVVHEFAFIWRRGSIYAEWYRELFRRFSA